MEGGSFDRLHVGAFGGRRGTILMHSINRGLKEPCNSLLQNRWFHSQEDFIFEKNQN